LLSRIESLKRIQVSLTLDAFTVEDGTVTSTMKLRRKDV
jgi:hypothetical protein